MNSDNKKNVDTGPIVRWVAALDEKDKCLAPLARKSKWVLILAGIFCLFVLFFLLFPMAGMKSEKLDTSFTGIKTKDQKKSTQSAFELPVDSFENQLKIKIDEDVLKKE